jgi:hypothetical protein
MRESLTLVIEIANANSHQFIRDAMFPMDRRLEEGIGAVGEAAIQGDC